MKLSSRSTTPAAVTGIFCVAPQQIGKAAKNVNVGAICLQGPHHSAQKSTITGLPALITSASKFSSVTLTVAI